jgi:hypothetical protein
MPTPFIGTRVEPELIADARKGAGLPPHAGVSEVVRYALAVLAGRPDPERIAAPRPRSRRYHEGQDA